MRRLKKKKNQKMYGEGNHHNYVKSYKRDLYLRGGKHKIEKYEKNLWIFMRRSSKKFYGLISGIREHPRVKAYLTKFLKKFKEGIEPKFRKYFHRFFER